jgi:uncharacterized protein (TIGR02246 family)
MPPTEIAAGLEGLHGEILDAWNRHDADGYAQCFTEDALVIGFDGSEMHGRAEVAEQLGAIFADHEVASYVRVVRGVRELADGVAVLHAVVGMIPPRGDDVMPDRHAVQVLLAVHEQGTWRAACLQNTPSQLHGRPDAVAALTDELRRAS